MVRHWYKILNDTYHNHRRGAVFKGYCCGKTSSELDSTKDGQIYKVMLGVRETYAVFSDKYSLGIQPMPYREWGEEWYEIPN